ncbi:TAXI family TRAP transporter solute-binding subunit [Chengkuizengella marina]|uniref:TAXI family TRAP transporter solute-binding subunit n=1 Tax=Chengkuizengella marina TaxID=2507566 RepID=A0A6N9Q7G0_9BACL|nr:TAXI family TRAP transporter solute-binding subunit [Chengkuizengella marina]NBI30710.1 TAXI family TRAP transporter solute-binding subunit [Chengkuizengella marina]
MKKSGVLIYLFIFSLFIAACGGTTEKTNTKPNGATEEKENEEQNLIDEAQAIVFGTGGTSGTYYPIGGALKPIFEQSDYIKNVTVAATGASVANIQNIQDGINQFAIVMSDVAYDALNGTGQFVNNKVDLKAFAGMYQNVVQVVATKDSAIQSIDDLKGKKVGVGKVGSGVEQSALKVLEAAGLIYDDLSKVTHTGYADSVQEMKNGNLDAAFFTSGIPNSNITDLMQSVDITFVEIKGEVASKLMEKYPFYKENNIPAGDEVKYSLDNEVKTVGIQNMLVVPSNLKDELVYDLAKHYYEYLGSEGVSVGALKQLNRNDIAKGLIAPIHPGAEMFYKEQGMLE